MEIESAARRQTSANPTAAGRVSASAKQVQQKRSHCKNHTGTIMHMIKYMKNGKTLAK